MKNLKVFLLGKKKKKKHLFSGECLDSSNF